VEEIKRDFYKNGNLRKEIYCKNGLLHREDGPAYINYFINEEVEKEYYKNGRRHRENGPAIIKHYEDGKIYYESYYINGKLHREDGPARIWYGYDGITIWSKEYYLNGEQVTDEFQLLVIETLEKEKCK